MILCSLMKIHYTAPEYFLFSYTLHRKILCCENLSRIQSGPDKPVMFFLITDRSHISVSGKNTGVVGKNIETIADGFLEIFSVACGQIGAAYGTLEEGIAADQDMAVLNVISAASFRVSGCEENFHSDAGHSHLLVVLEVMIRTEGVGTAYRGGLVESGIFTQALLVDTSVDRSAGPFSEFLKSQDVVKVRMSQEDRLYIHAAFLQLLVEPVAQIGGIKDNGLIAVLPVEKIAICLDHADHKIVYLDDFIRHYK